jgi:hypothetical protein
LCPGLLLLDDRGQGQATDQLHGIVGSATLTADGIHGHNVRMLQAGCGLRFILEPLPLPGVQRGRGGQHLESDRALQRDLLGVVDNTHAASTQLANDAKVAQVAANRLRGKWRLNRRGVGLAGRQRLQQRQGGQHPAQDVSQVRMLPHHLLDLRIEALLDLLHEGIDDLGHGLFQRAIAAGDAVAHDVCSSSKLLRMVCSRKSPLLFP